MICLNSRTYFFTKVALLVLANIRFSFLRLHYLAQLIDVCFITEYGQQGVDVTKVMKMLKLSAYLVVSKCSPKTSI